MLENLWLIAPGPSLYTLQEVNDAVEGFYYNDSSNFAALQSGILSVTKALIVENSLVIDGVETASFTIDENTTAVATITATAPQSDELTYSISGGADAALYQIDENTGAFLHQCAGSRDGARCRGQECLSRYGREQPHLNGAPHPEPRITICSTPSAKARSAVLCMKIARHKTDVTSLRAMPLSCAKVNTTDQSVDFIENTLAIDAPLANSRSAKGSQKTSR